MKLIAIKPFYNNIEPRLEITDALHPNHVHKGAIFNIGKDNAGKDISEFDNLSKTDQRTVALLKLAGCIGDANDQEILETVNKEVAAENKAEANTKRLLANQAGTDLLAQLISSQNQSLKTKKHK